MNNQRPEAPNQLALMKIEKPPSFKGLHFVLRAGQGLVISELVWLRVVEFDPSLTTLETMPIKNNNICPDPTLFRIRPATTYQFIDAACRFVVKRSDRKRMGYFFEISAPGREILSEEKWFKNNW